MQLTLTVDVTSPELGYELVELGPYAVLELVDQAAGDVIRFRAHRLDELAAFLGTLLHAVNERREPAPPAAAAGDVDQPEPIGASTGRAEHELELRAEREPPIDTLAAARVVFEGRR